MLFQLLSDPILLIPVLAAIILAFTFHEFAHAAAAELLGDSTPKSLGRLTLNPISHIDPLGFFLLILAGFGWGKPVPFNPVNLKNPKSGSAIIGLAGPFANLILGAMALLAIIVLRNLGLLDPNSLLTFFLVILVQFNVVLMIFNLIPVPPLDGSKILLAVVPDKYAVFKHNLINYGPTILFGLILLDAFSNISIFSRLFSFFLDGVNRLIV